MTRVRSFVGRLLGLAAASTLGLAGAALGDVKPGDTVTAANLEQAKGLISPGLEWSVKRGMAMKVVDYKKVEWPKAYREATEKYSSQVKLNAAGDLEGYVAGQPFPKIDPNDPQAALKVMWNFEHKFLVTDDSDARNFDADTGPVFGGNQPMSVERHFVIDHVRALRYVGRLYLDPKPLKQSPENFEAKAGLYPILEPFDLKGVGGLTQRYVEAGKQDDTWIYMPSLRRVRRLSTAQRSDALFGQDIDVDSFWGYSGKPGWMEWKFLGEKPMLSVWHAQNYPTKWGQGGADFAPDEVWELRPTYIVEGVSKLSQYAYSKRVIYIDKEAFGVSYSDMYDRSGNLWKSYMNFFSMRKQPFADAKVSVYPDEMAFLPGVALVDIQLQHGTRVALPSPRFPGEEGWYFNLGDKSGTSDDWFTMARLIASGR